MNIEQLDKLIVDLNDRADVSVPIYSTIGTLLGFSASFLFENFSVLDHFVLCVIGLIVGRLLGVSNRNDLKERALIVQMQKEMYDKLQ